MGLGTGDYSQIVTKRESDYIQSVLYLIHIAYQCFP